MTAQNAEAIPNKRVSHWVESIESIEKASTRRTNRSIVLGIFLGIVVSALTISLLATFAAIPDYVGILLGYVPPIAIPVILYRLWAKRSKNQAVQALLEEIQQECDMNDWSRASVVEALVTRLPQSNVCAAIAARLDPEVAASVKKQAVAVYKEQQARARALPRYDKLVYQEVSKIPMPENDVVRIVCPVCGEAHSVNVQEFRSLFEPSGQFLRVEGPATKWLVLIGFAVIVFLCAISNGYDPAMSCAIATAVTLTGGAFLLRAILVPVLTSAFSKRIPIWLFSCPDCGTIIPVASDGDVFLVGEIQKKKDTQ